MSEDAIRALNRRIEELTAENADLKSEAKSRRINGKKLQGELDELKKANGTLTTERDRWKGQAEAKPTELTARVEELQGKLRDATHRSAFHEKAQAAGIDPKTPAGKRAIQDLWTLSGYKAEGDEPDAAAIDSAIAAAKEERPYLFGSAPAAEQPAPKPAEKPRLEVPVDTTRGGGDASRAAGFRVTSANLQDLGWMQQNAGKMREAKANGTLVFE